MCTCVERYACCYQWEECLWWRLHVPSTHSTFTWKIIFEIRHPGISGWTQNFEIYLNFGFVLDMHTKFGMIISTRSKLIAFQQKSKMAVIRHLRISGWTKKFKIHLNSGFVLNLHTKCDMILSTESKVTGILRSRAMKIFTGWGAQGHRFVIVWEARVQRVKPTEGFWIAHITFAKPNKVGTISIYPM